MTEPTRRTALTALLCASLASAADADPTVMPAAPRLLVAGPGGGAADRWADILGAALARALSIPAPLPREVVGGADGVTGANQFQVRSLDDGATALVVPGDAALAYLVGDSRVRFETGRWVPLWGVQSRAALFSRVAPSRGRKLRLAVTSFASPDLAAVLTLDLLGVDVEPVSAAGDADALLLRGPELDAAGARFGSPVFTLGTPAQTGELIRDPSLPAVPTALELVLPASAASSSLRPALRAVCAAAGLGEGLVLPLLAPAAVVAWWRQACHALADDGDVQAEASRRRETPLSTGALSSRLAALNVDAATLIDLRRWLADRYHWRPS